jgi:hypothetical protein
MLADATLTCRDCGSCVILSPQPNDPTRRRDPSQAQNDTRGRD